MNILEQLRKLAPSGGTIDKIVGVAERILPRNEKARAAIFVAVGTLFGLFGPWTVNGILASFQERASFPMILARIEQLRTDARAIPCGIDAVPYQALVAAVVETNLRIAYEKKANSVWYADLFSPDGWNSVEAIEIGRCPR